MSKVHSSNPHGSGLVDRRRPKNHSRHLSVDPKNARLTALAVLNRMDREDLTLDAMMVTVFNQLPTMTARDRALTQTIVYGVLRWQHRLDAYIAHFSKTPLKRIDPIVRNLLRMGMYLLLYLDRIPASAVVHTTVELTKPHAPPWVVRFVNGLLRETTRHQGQLPSLIPQKNTIDNLAIDKSMPVWLLKRWMKRFGKKDTAALCDAINLIPDITLRINSLKTQRGQAAEALLTEAGKVTPTRYSPVGIMLSGIKRTIAQMAPFESGLFQVQDEAAQLVSMILNPQPGDTILDACAGLGGKTCHIAQLMQNTGIVTALDKSAAKLNLLKQELKRLGITCVTTTQADWYQDTLPPTLPQFDRILLDAPCSGIGVIRRNPDIKWRAEKSNLGRYSRQQRLFLERLAPLVRSGGILVYAVCSFEPEENESVVNGFLKNHSEFAKEDIGQIDSNGVAALGCRDGFLRTFPHRHNMDGFFAARLKKMR